ncbi:hypothetical protein EVJ58_g10695 [Rhodofomes roseus]|uniref:Uncharacterized protein n=1 Tax=Rhodofomes roseus TaxID=34475 RepID=A0A4Y9XN60_9APHY|nr:hypothetical protein EVJ58_g10695 [Rhodofomes roseus]
MAFLNKTSVQRFSRAVTARPEIATLVKNVVVSSSILDLPAEETLGGGAGMTWALAAINLVRGREKKPWPLDGLRAFVLMLARKLDGLERLCIVRGEWKAGRLLPRNNAMYQGFSAFRSLSTLVLCRVSLPSAREFKDIVLAISGLVRLECQTIYWKKVGAIDPTETRALHPMLRSFHNVSITPSNIIGQPQCPIIESFSNLFRGCYAQ